MLRKLERAGGFQAIEPLVERLMWQGRAEANVRFFVAHADASTPDTPSPDALEMAVLKLAWRLAPTWRVTRTHRAACRANGGLSPMRRRRPRCPAAAGRFGGTAWLRRRTSPRRCWAVRRTGGERGGGQGVWGLSCPLPGACIGRRAARRPGALSGPPHHRFALLLIASSAGAAGARGCFHSIPGVPRSAGRQTPTAVPHRRAPQGLAAIMAARWPGPGRWRSQPCPLTCTC